MVWGRTESRLGDASAKLWRRFTVGVGLVLSPNMKAINIWRAWKSNVLPSPFWWIKWHQISFLFQNVAYGAQRMLQWQAGYLAALRAWLSYPTPKCRMLSKTIAFASFAEFGKARPNVELRPIVYRASTLPQEWFRLHSRHLLRTKLIDADIRETRLPSKYHIFAIHQAHPSRWWEISIFLPIYGRAQLSETGPRVFRKKSGGIQFWATRISVAMLWLGATSCHADNDQSVVVYASLRLSDPQGGYICCFPSGLKGLNH